jgi:hypothetical protein
MSGGKNPEVVSERALKKHNMFIGYIFVYALKG